MYRVLGRILRNNCTRPRDFVFYTPTRKVLPKALPEGVAEARLYYGVLEQMEEEEYVLLDFNALVSAVGGVVGMLLGWSALDLFRILARPLDKLS